MFYFVFLQLELLFTIFRLKNSLFHILFFLHKFFILSSNSIFFIVWYMSLAGFVKYLFAFWFWVMLSSKRILLLAHLHTFIFFLVLLMLGLVCWFLFFLKSSYLNRFLDILLLILPLLYLFFSLSLIFLIFIFLSLINIIIYLYLVWCLFSLAGQIMLVHLSHNNITKSFAL